MALRQTAEENVWKFMVLLFGFPGLLFLMDTAVMIYDSDMSSEQWGFNYTLKQQVICDTSSELLLPVMVWEVLKKQRVGREKSGQAGRHRFLPDFNLFSLPAQKFLWLHSFDGGRRSHLSTELLWRGKYEQKRNQFYSHCGTELSRAWGGEGKKHFVRRKLSLTKKFSLAIYLLVCSSSV